MLAHVGEADLLGDLVGLGVRAGEARHRPPEHRRQSVAQRAGERQIVAHGELGKQAVALERAGDADARAGGHVEAGHVAVLEQDGAGIGPQIAGEQVEIGGLAGAVRADDRVAQRGFEREAHVLRHGERAERLVERAGLERDHAASSVAEATRRPAAAAIGEVEQIADDALRHQQSHAGKDNAEEQIPVADASRRARP